MGVEKVSVSFELALGEAIRGAAAERGLSVSAWLAEAARDRLRNEALGEAIRDWEAEFGPLTEAEVAAAERLLDKAQRGRSRGAA